MERYEQSASGAPTSSEELLRDGTPESVARLWVEIEPWVRAMARRVAGRTLSDYVDDLVGETNLRLLRLRGRQVKDLRHYLARVIRNLALDEIRRRAAKPTTSLEVDQDQRRSQEGHYSDDMHRRIENGGGCPGPRLEVEITVRNALNYYGDLQPRRSAIFAGYYIEGQTTKALAATLGTTVEAIQRELSRARNDLRTIFEPRKYKDGAPSCCERIAS